MPGEEVAPVFAAADIAHLSNEVSFAADCPYPDAYGGMTFCSRDPYFDLLKQLGIDVIELTGNHLNDWGREPLARSLEMYAAAGMQWYGGGRDLADATRPLVIDPGSRIAFVGCNPSAQPATGRNRPLVHDLWARRGGADRQLRAEGRGHPTLQYIEAPLRPAGRPDRLRRIGAAGAATSPAARAHAQGCLQAARYPHGWATSSSTDGHAGHAAVVRRYLRHL
jgi:poly-gamma-glutamate synthesis protein (capsule biosynthesis protein)